MSDFEDVFKNVALILIIIIFILLVIVISAYAIPAGRMIFSWAGNLTHVPMADWFK